MLIRSLKWKGLPMWPPEWMMTDQGAGEEGVLEEVALRVDLKPNSIIVVANHLGDIRKGILVLENPAHLQTVYAKLKEHLGRPLEEIGNLEITLFPSLEKRGPRQVRSPSPIISRSVHK